MGHLLEGILRLPPAVALPLVFLLPGLEASAFIGVVIPGEVGVVLGGVLANQHKLPLAAVLVAGVAGAVLGDSIGYWVGARYGDQLLARLPQRVVKPEHGDTPCHGQEVHVAGPSASRRDRHHHRHKH